tara:strand:- start:2473 stop:3579 length:1107 start_codon:yes stop_codon:yes gene_type:complete
MKIFIIAGEPSGDEYGAKLIAALKNDCPNLSINGIGGPLMEKQGLNSMVPLNQIAVMGFGEVIKKIKFFINLEKKILRFLKINSPDKIILIDYPGFNLRIAKKIKKNSNIKIIYYISPQIWAWKEKRINTIKKYVDILLVIFEFEKNWYEKRGVTAHYVGHPFLDIWEPGIQTDNLYKKYNINSDQPILTLFPGSRKQELERHLSLFIESALEIKRQVPNLQILLGLHPELKFNGQINNEIIVVQDNPLKALEISNAAIISSGTATLQSAIMETPAVVVYKMNWFSWLITKLLVKVKFASMANIIMNEELYSEYLQHKATKFNIVNGTLKILNDKAYYDLLMNKIKILKQKIGNPGASNKAAKLIEKV